MPGGSVRIEGEASGTYKVSGQAVVSRQPDGTYKEDLWVHGTRHTLLGKIDMAGYVFEGDRTDPLIFRVDRGLGYVFVRGAGSVRLKNGEKISLYRPWFLWFWR